MILHLNLKKEWFDRHLLDKNDDYREVTPYWCNKLIMVYDHTKEIYVKHGVVLWGKIFAICDVSGVDITEIIHNNLTSGHYRYIECDTVVYSNGMLPIKILPRFEKEFLGIEIGYGNTNHGAPKDTKVFIIRCGKVLNKQNC